MEKQFKRVSRISRLSSITGLFILGTQFIATMETRVSALPLCEESAGGPTVVDNALRCNFKTIINEQDGERLDKVTNGLVREIQISSRLELPLLLTSLFKIFTDKAISIPQQEIGVNVVMGELLKAPNLQASLVIKPTIDLAGDTICDVKATSARVNLTLFASDLPDSIDKIIADRINLSSSLNDGLAKAADELISTVRPSFCTK